MAVVALLPSCFGVRAAWKMGERSAKHPFAYRDYLAIVSDVRGTSTVSRQLEHGCKMIHAGCPSFFGFGSEDVHVPTFWLLL